LFFFFFQIGWLIEVSFIHAKIVHLPYVSHLPGVRNIKSNQARHSLLPSSRSTNNVHDRGRDTLEDEIDS
jgi:hypothetical protein